MQRLSRLALQVQEMLSFSNDKTDYDPQVRALLVRADRTKYMTKRLVDLTKDLMGPRHTTERNCLEEMGHSMHLAGRCATITTSNYGILLVKVGEIEERLGRVEKEFVVAVYSKYVDPMEVYFRLESKSIGKEQSTLEKRRLDLDIAKKKRKKASTNDQRIASCQNVKQAQAEFDRQSEVLQMVLERVAKTNDEHLNHLKEFVQLQGTYFKKCNKLMKELNEELNKAAPNTQL